MKLNISTTPRHVPCTLEQYHEREELSNSQLSDYLDPEKGPLYYHGMHFCRPPLWSRPTKKAWDFGNVVHQLISSPGAIDELAVEVPINQFLTDKGEAARNPMNTKAYKNWAAENVGKIHLKPEEFSAAKQMVARAYEHPAARKILETALHYEHTLIWIDEATGLPLRSRCDIGSGIKNMMIVTDAKTTRALSRWQFAYDARKYGYHRQAAFYTRPWRLLGYDVPTFVFIALSKQAPYPCRVYEMDSEALLEGEEEISDGMTELSERMRQHGDKPRHDITAWRTILDVSSTVVSLPKKRQ